MVTGGSSRHSTHRVSFWPGTLIMMGSGWVFEPGSVAYGHDRAALLLLLLLLFLDILYCKGLEVSGQAVVALSLRKVLSQDRSFRLSLVRSDTLWSRPCELSPPSACSAKGVGRQMDE